VCVSILTRLDRWREVSEQRPIRSVGDRNTGQDTVTASFDRVAVLGLGLIGGSLLHAVRHSGLDVVGYDIDP
jgi:phosphoglycerate dehydrogenase-like enzyme